ncbi:ATP-binding protein [Kitasatospora sp. NPDC048538]|uniref:ATP-binding protein n=1 Tax=unclassified Kitasatospora TaxID=2633591 RepID=UPI0033DDC51B
MTGSGGALEDGRTAAGPARPPVAQLRRLRLAGVPKPVARAREFTSRALADWAGPGSSAEAERDVVLLVAELVSNAVMHAGGALELALSARTGRLRIEVGDGSPALPALCTPRPPASPGGHGLLIVERLACRWGVEPRGPGKTVWAETGIPGRPPAADCA